MKKYLFLIAVTLWSMPMMPQERRNFDPSTMPKEGTIIGKIQDLSSGQYIEYATISLYNQRDSNLVTGAISTADGSFILKELPYGIFYLEASFIGFKKTRLTKILITPRNKALNIGVIKIEPSATALDEVEVVADRQQVEYKIDKKVVNVSQNIAASGGSAVDVLENTPSVQVDIEGNVELRGSSNFTVLIDGKPSVLKGSEALQQLPASTIESIEIITNPSAKFDPDGSAGIINVLMKKQKQSGITGIMNASVSTNDSYSGDFLFNLRNQKFNYYIGGEYNKRIFGTDGFMDRQTFLRDTTFNQVVNSTGEFNRDGSGIKGGFDYYLDSKNTLSLSGSYRMFTFGRSANSNYHEFSNPELLGEMFYLRDNDFKITRNFYEINFDYQLKFNETGHQLLASTHYSNGVSDEQSSMHEYTTTGNWENLGLAPYIERTIEGGDESELRTKIDYTYPISEKSKFEAGYQGRYGLSDESYRFETYLIDLNSWQEDAGRYNDKDFSDIIHSLYSTYSNSFKLFDYQLGLRVEYNNRKLEQHVSNEEYLFSSWDFFPTLHLSKKLPLNFQVQASYSRRIDRPRERFLDPFEIYIDPQNVRKGNPALKPEYTNSIELNTQKSFKGTGFVSAELFYRQTTNLISRIRLLRNDNVMVNTYENVNSDYRVGGELMLNIPIRKWWSVNTSASLFHYKLEGEIVDQTVDNNTLTWNARFNSTFRLKWGTGIQIMGFYNAPSITPQGTREGFFFTNLGIRQYLFNRKATVSLRVRDLLGMAKFEFTSEGNNFYTYNKMSRKSQIVTFSISYKINNYKQKARRKGEEDMNEIEFDSNNDSMF